MTQYFKIFIFLFALCSFVACTNKDQDDATESSKASPQNESITINGIVESVEFGKDGYTATVLTKDSKVYYAVVSIVNLGGPDNYSKVNVKDQVTLKGDYQKRGDKHYLKVTEKPSTEKKTEAPLIDNHYYHGITPGDKIDKHLDILTKDLSQKSIETTRYIFNFFDQLAEIFRSQIRHLFLPHS